AEGLVEFVVASTYVYVMTDSLPKPVYERRAITTGLSDGIRIEVKDGIDSNATLRGDKIK
ncbi:MAG: efflux transporter periplasmic adaptor subunit, partial [Muribaculaceae bacterium]|nr:efflux transporter periplasmic adaptor subunit [Muribaculaceae bacterium]